MQNIDICDEISAGVYTMNKHYIPMIFLFFSFHLQANVLKLIYEKGTVTITRSNKIIKTKDIFPADKITTGPQSLAILKGERETLKIEANSEIVYQHGSTTEDSTVNLNLGSIISKLAKKKFQVKVKSVSMGVRGTQFFSSIDMNDKIWMGVNEGTVEVNDGHHITMVPAGQGVSVINGETSKPQVLAWMKNLNWEMDPSKQLEESKILIQHLEEHKEDHKPQAQSPKASPSEEKSIYDD